MIVHPMTHTIGWQRCWKWEQSYMRHQQNGWVALGIISHLISSHPRHHHHAVQRKAARFVTRNYKRDSSVSTMIQQLKWQSLEKRRAVSRLTFTYKALHKIIAVNLDHLKSSKSSRPTRLNSSAFTLRKLATKKDKYKTLCFQEHHLSGTYYQTMWNQPPH